MWLFLIISFKGSTGRLRIVTLQSSDTPLKRVSAGSAMGGDAGMEASERIGRNHAYLQQFLERGIPAALPEEARERLAELLGVPQDELRGTGPRQR